MPTEYNNNIESITQNDLIGVWRYFDVKFIVPLSRNDKSSEFSYIWPLISDFRTASPFTSTSTGEPTKKLVIEVRLGSDYAGRKLVIEEFQAIEGTAPIKCSAGEFDEQGSYIWEVKHPKRFRCYRIRWTWNANDDIPLVQSVLIDSQSQNSEKRGNDVNQENTTSEIFRRY